ncbi:MAG: hypothetical protein JXA93_09730 [Anaerolineae bacterium]|nr:hypothetical protein [Anaerolineae bacterium]
MPERLVMLRMAGAQKESNRPYPVACATEADLTPAEQAATIESKVQT